MGGGESFGPQHVAALKAAIGPVTEVANSQQGVVPFAVASFHDDGPVVRRRHPSTSYMF